MVTATAGATVSNMAFPEDDCNGLPNVDTDKHWLDIHLEIVSSDNQLGEPGVVLDKIAL